MRNLQIAAVVALAGMTLAAPRQAQASGFGIAEHSARIMGMAGAFTGVADSPGTLFFNPAGIAQLDGLQLEAGLTIILPSASYTGDSPTGVKDVEVGAEKHTFFIPNIHASYRVHDRFAVGLSVYVPYGLTQSWADTTDVNGTTTPWWGRDIVRKIALETVNIVPTVGVKLHERVLLGVGFAVVKGAVTMDRAVVMTNQVADDIDFKLSGEDWGFGATAGLLVKILPNILNVGVGYRSGVAMTFSGNAAFTKDGSGANVPSGLRSRLTDGVGTAVLNLPHVISFGVGAFPIKGLTLGVTADLITWSSYDKLAITFADNPELDTSDPKDWNNTVTVRVGAEYDVIKDLGVRLGFIYDMGPIPENRIGPELPDSDRYEFTVGVGYEIIGIRIDAAYQYLFTGSFKTGDLAPLVGSYNANAHLIGFSLGYHLDI